MLKRLLRTLICGILLFNLIATFLPSNSIEAIVFMPEGNNTSMTYYSYSTYGGTVEPPYKNIGNTWTHELALGWAWSSANYNTGFISTSAFSYAGGATAEATQFIDINIPGNQLSEVTVVASIIYTGGSQKIGIGASAWGGVDKVWYIGDEYHKEPLDAVFGWDDVGWAATDLALALAPGIGSLTGLSETAKVMRVVEALSYINEVAKISKGFYDLYNAGKASRTTITFSYLSDQSKTVGVGLRVDTSGCLLGACDTTVVGYVEKIYVCVSPIVVKTHWNFNDWDGVRPNIFDNATISPETATVYNGVTSVSTSRYQRGVRLDGIDDWIELNFDYNERMALTRQGTIEVWVKPEEVRRAMILWAGSGSDADGWGPEPELHLSITEYGNFCFSYSSLNSNSYFRSVYFGSYTPGNWYHICITYRNSPYGEVNCYINGSRLTDVSSYCSKIFSSADLVFNRVSIGKAMTDSWMFKGEIDELRVYSAIRSDSEVRCDAWLGLDVTPPPVPVMIPEPQFTAGSENMVACESVLDNESGIFQYEFEVKNNYDPNENYIRTSKSPSCLFENLNYWDNNSYSYRVRAVDYCYNTSSWSEWVTSIQDNFPPVLELGSSYTVAGTVQNNEIFFDLPLNVTDVDSGIASVYTDFTLVKEHAMPEPYQKALGSLRISIPLYAGSQYTVLEGKTVGGRVTDAAGNVTEFSIQSLRVDYQLPQGSILIENGAWFTYSQTVTLNLSYWHPGNGFNVSQMRFSNDNISWSNWESARTVRTGWKLSEGYGYKTVYVQFKDEFGHISYAYSDSINYGPEVTDQGIIVNGGSVYTTSRLVNLSLYAENADEMIIWEEVGTPSGNIPTVGWENYSTSKSYNLGTQGDGQKFICVSYRNRTTYSPTVPVYAAIYLDTHAPQGIITINGGNSVTNSTHVALSLYASDEYQDIFGVTGSGIDAVRLDNGDDNWTQWQAYKTNFNWELLLGDGQKTVRAQYRDAAGNVTKVVALINLDTCPPSGNIRINGEQKFTRSTQVNIVASVVGEQYSLPEQFSSVQGGSGWYYYASLSPGDYHELVWDYILGSEQIKQEFYSWNRAIGADDVEYLQIACTGEETYLATGEPAVEGSPCNIAVGWIPQTGDEGTYYIKAELWAAASEGEPESNKDDGVWLYIIVNDEKMTEPVRVFHNKDYSYGCVDVKEISLTNKDRVYFYIDRGEGAVNDKMYYRFTISRPEKQGPCSVRFANLLPKNIDNKSDYGGILWWQSLHYIDWTMWFQCTEENSVERYFYEDWELASGEGTKTVIAQFMDSAGNISIPVRTEITLDQTPPGTCSIVIDGGASRTNSAIVNLELFASDSVSSVIEMKISENGSSGKWEPYIMKKAWRFAEEGVRSLEVIFKDAAGNVSSPYRASILYDSLFSASKQRFGLIRSVEQADVNGDGLNDLLVISAKSSSMLTVLVNVGNGVFQPLVGAFSSLVTEVYKVLPGDLNNDGSLDLVVIPSYTSSGVPVRILMNNGEGYFTLSQEINDMSVFYEGALGDVDHDGDVDLVLSGKITASHLTGLRPVVRVYLNNKGVFSHDNVAGDINVLATALTIGDINGDGKSDIILGCPIPSSLKTDPDIETQGSLSVLIFCRLDGSYQDILYLPAPEGVTISGRFPLVLCDLDGDADQDIISGGSSTVIWINEGEGNFTSQVQNFISSQIVPADINSDGFLDLIVSQKSGDYLLITLHLNNGIPGDWLIYPVTYTCRSSFAVGDLNDDDRPDLVLGLLCGESSIWYEGTPSGLVFFDVGDLNAVPLVPCNLQNQRDGNEVTFSWDEPGIGEQLTYNLRVGTRPGGNDICSGVVPAGSGNAGTGLSRVIYLPDGKYFWSVQSVDGGFVHSKWAEEQVLVVDTLPPSGVSCLSPADGDTEISVTPQLICSGVSDDTGGIEYYFEVAEDSNFSVGLEVSGWQVSNSWQVYGLCYGRTYYWRVKARDCSGNESEFCVPYSFSTVRAPKTVWNLPRQYSGVQGQDNWYYYAHKQGSAMTDLRQLSFDNYVEPWGFLNRSTWNGTSRYLEIVGRDSSNWQDIGPDESSGWLQPGEYGYNNIAVAWKAPQTGTIYIDAMVNVCSPHATANSSLDDGIYFSIYKGEVALKGPIHVFRGENESNRMDYACLKITTTVNADEKIYFYVDRGYWQNADGVYYSFSISYSSEADLEAPVSHHQVGENWFALFAEDTGSGVARIEYRQYYPVEEEWQEYTGPVVLQPGEYRFMYRALDNNGNVEVYHRISVNATTPTILYNVNTVINGCGKINLNPEQTGYLSGTSVQLMAQPDKGWEFTGWTGDVEGENNPITVVITKDVDVIANFALIGDVNCDGCVNVQDMTYVVRQILGLDPASSRADVNKDEDINVLDITNIAIIILNSGL